MILNRKCAPPINPISNLAIIPAKKTELLNGIPLYYLNSGTSDLVKIEWMFEAGNWFQNSPLVAFSVNNTLIEGTENYSFLQIIQSIEYFGASVGYSVDKDNAFIYLVSMSKYLPNVLPLMEELIKRAIFPEHEIETFKNKHKQQFLIEQTKVASLARINHAGLLYGENHPYGYIIKDSDFDALSTNKLKEFYKKFYHSKNCTIIVSGKVRDSELLEITKYFGDESWGTIEKYAIPNFKNNGISNQKLFLEKPDAVQNAVRIGKVLFNKAHPDYAGLTVLNCLLGGYFGSRLMKKVREEKGYTYGINSLFVTFVHSGFLAIMSEVGSDVITPALSDIYGEIERLRQETVPDDELQRVKNYMLGEMVRMFDGPFAQADSLISLLEYALGYEHFNEVIKTIQTINSEQILLLAQKYLDPSSMCEIVVGKKG